MRSLRRQQSALLTMMLVVALMTIGCTDEFYLSEKETVAYAGALSTQATANANFDNLQGRSINIRFDNSSGQPRLQSINLLAEMRRTELAQLESGSARVSLDRLSLELEKQIGNWIDGRLQLYTSSSNDIARLTALDSVDLSFLNNPTFTYRPERQSIEFDVTFQVHINGTIEVNAVNWLINLFTNINGTYPLSIHIFELRLRGEASMISPYANAGRIRFQLRPELVYHTVPGPVPIQLAMTVTENGQSSPEEVRLGVHRLLTRNLSSPVDEIFYQDYDYFSLSHLGLTSATSQVPSRLEVTYRPKADRFGPAESTNPMLHIVTRALDGKLYHARKSDGGWSSYNAIVFPSPSPTPYPRIDNDPTLVDSGAGQLELVATDASGDLVYGHWRDEQWGNWQVIPPNTSFQPALTYRGKPAVVASAPGQVEVICEVAGIRLAHIRRINGTWQPPVLLPQLANMPYPFRYPSAVQVGNKIAVVYIDGANHLFGQIFDMETGAWGNPITASQMQETVRFAPVAATIGDESTDQVAVVYVGQSGKAYLCRMDVDATNLVPPVVTTGGNLWQASVIGGAFNSAPALAASGHRELELIGRWNDNILRHNHYYHALGPKTVDGRTINPGWQGWTLLNDNVSATGTTTDGMMSEFSIAATASGRVELAARSFAAYSYTTRNVFHNNHENLRFGRAPWKTVHWRGYQMTGTELALGRPALVAIDRNFQVGFVGNGTNVTSTLNHARLSASNLTLFGFGPPARATQNPAPPVILSSGLGTQDYIYIGNDNRLHHDRMFSGGSGMPYTVNVPNGLILLGQPAAVSYGNGFIEMAALLSDGCIYHWRFRDGVWSNGTGVTCRMLSAPALVYTGGDKLELFAVDLDYKLFRWRFLGTTWAPRLAVSSDFRINEGLFGQSSASSWGDGTVDVVVVNKDTRELHHRRVGPDSELCTSNTPWGCPAPRVFSNLGGRVEDKPVLTAFSPTNLNVLTMSGLEWYSNWAQAEFLQPVTFPRHRDLFLRWSGFANIGGSEMVVSSSANSGRLNYVALAIHFGGRIFINRYQEGRWTGFQPIVGQTPEMIIRSPLILPALAAYGG